MDSTSDEVAESVARSLREMDSRWHSGWSIRHGLLTYFLSTTAGTISIKLLAISRAPDASGLLVQSSESNAHPDKSEPILPFRP